MILPDYWLPRPPMPQDPSTRADFDHLYDTLIAHPQQPIDYTLDAPKWQFLCYLADERHLALHGSSKPNITRFEPRQSNDIEAFGNQCAVYAAADGVWPMFFAILDRSYHMSLCNACIRFMTSADQLGESYYQFSVSQSALPSHPWQSGTVYLLPRDSFVQQESMRIFDQQAYPMQLASFTPVDPLASLSITPDDFPFLSDIRGHDDARIQEYVDALMNAAPWPT